MYYIHTFIYIHIYSYPSKKFIEEEEEEGLEERIITGTTGLTKNMNDSDMWSTYTDI